MMDEKNQMLCEIAYICGALKDTLQTEIKDYDLFDMYANVYEPIYKDWVNKIGTQNEEEIGYISTYAERILKEQYCN